MNIFQLPNYHQFYGVQTFHHLSTCYFMVPMGKPYVCVYCLLAIKDIELIFFLNERADEQLSFRNFLSLLHSQFLLCFLYRQHILLFIKFDPKMYKSVCQPPCSSPAPCNPPALLKILDMPMTYFLEQ